MEGTLHARHRSLAGGPRRDAVATRPLDVAPLARAATAGTPWQRPWGLREHAEAVGVEASACGFDLEIADGLVESGHLDGVGELVAVLEGEGGDLALGSAVGVGEAGGLHGLAAGIVEAEFDGSGGHLESEAVEVVEVEPVSTVWPSTETE